MSVPSEIINQSVFTAALFLTLISVPKLIVLTVWYTYRILLFRNLEKIAKGKYLKEVVKGDALQSLVKMSENPVLRLEQTVKEYGNFLKYVRDPIIEAFTALIIMFVLSSIFPEITAWLTVSFIVVIIVVLWSFALAILFTKDINRTRIADKGKADNLEAESNPT